MAIEFQCQCGRKFNVSDDKAGMRGRCPACNAVMVIPSSPLPPPQAEPTYVPEVHLARPAEPPVRQPAISYAPVVNVSVPVGRKANALGVCSLVFGCLAVAICWIPFCGLFSWPFAGLAIILGGVGLVIALADKQSAYGSSIGGMVTGGVAIGLSFLVTGLLSAAIKGKAGTDQPPTPFGSAAKFGADIDVSIVRAWMDRPALRTIFGTDNGRHEKDVLAVRFSVRNLSKGHRYYYSGGYTENLTDNLGNRYHEPKFSGYPEPAHDKDETTLDPGGEIQDVAYFDPPLPQAKSLVFEVFRDNVSRDRDGREEIEGPEIARLAIPVDKIDRN